MNISYTRKGDYLLPNLILKEKVQYNIGKYFPCFCCGLMCSVFFTCS